MADQHRIQELADVEDAATQQAIQQHQQGRRAQQEEVPTQPATSPRSIDLPVQEWAVASVHQGPPPPQAQRIHYQQPAGEWREAIPCVVHYGHQSEEEYQRDADAARRARLEDRWDKQRREEAEREARERYVMKPLYVGKLKCEKQATFQQRRFQQVHHQ